MSQSDNNRNLKIIIVLLSIVATIGLSLGGWALAQTVSQGREIASLQATQAEREKGTDKFRSDVKAELNYIKRRLDTLNHSDLSQLTPPGGV
jgi:hypothetical protein